MSQVFATALLISLSAGSLGWLTTLSPPAQPLSSSSVQGTLVDAAKASPVLSLAQVEPISSPEVLAAAADSLVVEVCLSLTDWQRPSDLAQAKQLGAMPHYGVALQSDPLAEMAKTWWSHDIFSFTTYGLSARVDPLYLSGVWTALDDTWDCYSGDQPEQINRGELAEMWLLHHRLVDLAWQDDHYVATVEPAESGLQLVQFARRESNPSLPLSIITTAGQALAVLSGDW
ncbi:MAG: hypothetical protein EA368_03640 [Leptolyngbya sp. DLM2.Bin27]|nr:MAG: hypothetical protein EA368_03640 [Leptolyngbya sp. DLM2.Bin27]